MTLIKDKLAINVTVIKIIAIVLMFFDHIYQMWVPYGAPIWLKYLGRPVFPLFLFAMAESFFYTCSRKKFLLRLFIAACIMVVFNMVLHNVLPNPNPNVQLMNGAFMTFFVTGLYMLFFDMLVDGIKTKKAGKIIGSALLFLAPVLTAAVMLFIGGLVDKVPFWFFQILIVLAMMLPSFIVEGGPIMIALGLLFYVLRRWRWAQVAVLVVTSALVFFLVESSAFQWMMVFAVIPMLLYNGEKGRGLKWFFYIFYPAHIYLLYIIATIFWK